MSEVALRHEAYEAQAAAAAAAAKENTKPRAVSASSQDITKSSAKNLYDEGLARSTRNILRTDPKAVKNIGGITKIDNMVAL